MRGQAQPVTMVMLTPEQLGSIIEDAVARGVHRVDEEPMNAREFANYLHISAKTLTRKIARGEVVPLPGRPLRFLRSSAGGR